MMPETPSLTPSVPAAPRPWDARLARRLVTPLKDSRATPNHLTSVRLAFGLAAAAAFLPGTYGWTNLGALLHMPPTLLGLVAGAAVALIFYLRMRIEEIGGKSASKQAAVGGFETEDVL